MELNAITEALDIRTLSKPQLSIPGHPDRRFRLNVTGCSGGT
jgi:hypothetical protein